MSICLSFAQIEKLEANCREYVATAREICGPAILACDVFKQDMHNASSLSQLSKAKLQEHIQKWRGTIYCVLDCSKIVPRFLLDPS